LAAPERDRARCRRFADNPIIRPEMLPGRDGDNINGPSLIRVPDWVDAPLGAYYLYFAHHHGTYIRLAYADHLAGPWHVHEPGSLGLEQVPGCELHIASPDVHVDHERRQIRMYFHGPARRITERPRQRTFVAVSPDGIHFRASDEVLGAPYLRAFHWDDAWYAMARWGALLRSRDGLSDFEAGPNPFPRLSGRALLDGQLRRAFRVVGVRNDWSTRPIYAPPSRHVAVQVSGDELVVYYSNIGDAPERIFRTSICLHGAWDTWRTTPPTEVLRPETTWEGATLPLRRSHEGIAHGPEHALRDPAVFLEGERTYLLYAVAGESGIAIAERLP
jgi:hypothetical protein